MVFPAWAFGFRDATPPPGGGGGGGGPPPPPPSAVRWGVAGRVVVAWLITIPASAAVGAVFYWLTTIW